MDLLKELAKPRAGIGRYYKMSVGYNLGTPAFERYGQDGKRIKRYAKDV